jgi:homoserine O-acetyltransferase/O-succinyltransferase
VGVLHFAESFIGDCMAREITLLAGSEIEIVGPADAPVIVVLGGISASRHVTESADNPLPGWWSNFVGPRKTIDTRRFRVASIDYHASSAEAGPLSSRDHALALCEALDAEGIDRLHAVVGASYGGTVALAFGALEPDRADHLIVYGAAHESAPIAAAHRILQRKVVELGIRAGLEREALVIARGLATTTYTTAEAFAGRFTAATPYERCDDIDEFLAAEGKRFASHCTPEKFLALSRSLDLDWIDPRSIRTPTTLIGVEEDALVPVSHLRLLADLIGAPCTLEIVNSRYGHDAFLDDPSVIASIVARVLGISPVTLS